jgi:membrane protein required for colicin V production
VSIINELSWIDWTSLAIVAYFLIAGLFRGFVWQASRLVSIVLAWMLATLFAVDLQGLLQGIWSELEGEPAFYLAFFIVLVAALVVLSIMTMLLNRLVKQLEMGFYNHLGGGLLGIATASGLIVAVLGLLYRVLPDSSPIVAAARSSHTARVSSFIVDKAPLPPEIQVLYREPAASESTLPTEPEEDR